MREVPPLDTEPQAPLLESATQDTYLALDARMIGPE